MYNNTQQNRKDIKELLLMLNVEKNQPILQIAPLFEPAGSIAELKYYCQQWKHG